MVLFLPQLLLHQLVCQDILQVAAVALRMAVVLVVRVVLVAVVQAVLVILLELLTQAHVVAVSTMVKMALMAVQEL
jgi:hypothetical protein